MSLNDSQVYRKRKVTECTYSDISDSETDDTDVGDESLEIRKYARLAPNRRISRDSVSHSDVHSSTSSSGFESSESEAGDNEKCPICLKMFRNQTLAITDSCIHHTFCLPCLEEWSKTRKTCPVDRQEYKSILVLDSYGRVTKQIAIESLSPTTDPLSDTSQSTFCEICGQFSNEEMMLLCDGCDMGFHMSCLSPQMESAPTGMWLCNDCWYYYNY